MRAYLSLVAVSVMMPLVAYGGCAATSAPTNPAIERAMRSVHAAIPRAEADPTRPVYHFRPPAYWTNDPNGPIFHKGYYHMFYQHNPYGDRWGHMHWGHARSRDLVYWEHLPIALWPSIEQGEEHCFSGCAVINDQGQPMIFYTSIGPNKRASDSADQWAAIGDDDLVNWRKHTANPVLSEALHGDQKILDWRDPFVFREDGRWFMVLGGHREGGKGCIALYTSEDLVQWRFLGIPFEGQERNWECPNFFKLGDKWVLIYSPHGLVRYYTGRFDLTTYTFTPEYHGTLDFGKAFYAPNCLRDPVGRRILWGWVRGFPGGRGWNGCHTLPRILSVRADGRLTQRPAAELKKLRREHHQVTNLRLTDASRVLESVSGDTLEIVAEFDGGHPGVVGLNVRRSADGHRSVPIRFDGQRLTVGEVSADFRLLEDESTLRLHVFLDKSVVEVYANDRACLTSVIDADVADVGVEVVAHGGATTLCTLDAWSLEPIWPVRN